MIDYDPELGGREAWGSESRLLTGMYPVAPSIPQVIQELARLSGHEFTEAEIQAAISREDRIWEALDGHRGISSRGGSQLR